MQDHTNRCVRPGLDYFRQKFVEDDAPLKRAIHGYVSIRGDGVNGVANSCGEFPPGLPLDTQLGRWRFH